MDSDPAFSKFGFIRRFVLPVFVIFLIPGFALWFFRHAEDHTDREILEVVLSDIRSDKEWSEDDRAAAIEFYSSTPVSRIMASNHPEAAGIQSQFSPVKLRYGVFRWMKRIAFVCLITSILALIAVGISVVCSFKSQQVQYLSLLVGWHILRIFAVIQVIGQGTLAVALSFWVTALWGERYFPKLILIIGILTIGAIFMIIRAIFLKVDQEAPLEGRLLSEEEAPGLWNRVAEMAGKLGISKPDQIFVGIDDNFFVTQHPVRVDDKLYTGRTLFASLSLLKVLSRGQADAVLAHELAHFSGEDTFYSLKISPLLQKYSHYLQALHEGGISRPVFHFMLLFWALYQLSLNKLSRVREFRADRIGSELTSAHDMAQALVKISAYCQYRAKVQNELFQVEENVEKMNVSQRLEEGFPGFMQTCITGTELAESGTPHPFDSHPPLASRIESLGLQVEPTIRSEENLEAVNDSWFSAIESAEEIENQQWTEFEQAFHRVHRQILAWRFKPEGEVEIKHVEEFFPLLRYKNKKDLLCTIDYEKIHVLDWAAPIFFSTIENMAMDDGIGKKYLKITYCPEGEKKKQTQKFCPADFTGEELPILDGLQKYYGRYLTAKEYQEEKANQAEAIPMG